MRFCKSLDALVKCLIKSSMDNRKFSYVIIQPCLYNRREMKVVCLNRKPIYVSKSANKKSSDGVNHSISDSPHQSLMEFAQKAVDCYLKYCPHAIVDGLFRVDIMQMTNKCYVVNELESLEAAYYSGSCEEALVHSCLESYWFKIITKLCSEHVLKNR